MNSKINIARKHFPMALHIPATSQAIEYYISHDKAEVERKKQKIALKNTQLND